MTQSEAKARIKINRLLEAAGWRFFDDEDGRVEKKIKVRIGRGRQGDSHFPK